MVLEHSHYDQLLWVVRYSNKSRCASLKYDGTRRGQPEVDDGDRETFFGFGTQTAGLFGGYVTVTVANVETYDGTSWSETQISALQDIHLIVLIILHKLRYSLEVTGHW